MDATSRYRLEVRYAARCITYANGRTHDVPTVMNGLHVLQRGQMGQYIQVHSNKVVTATLATTAPKGRQDA